MRTNHQRKWPVPLLALLLGLAGPGLPRPVPAATLTDFGYEHMKVTGELSKGTRGMVLILADFSVGVPGVPPLARNSTNEFIDFVFNKDRTNTVNGFFWENSNGRFQWTNAGVIGPLTNLTSYDMLTNYEAIGRDMGNPWQGEAMFFSNLIYKAMATGFDFARFDRNGDNVITNHELGILIISNTRESSGQGRWTCFVKPAGSLVAINQISGLGCAVEVSHRELMYLCAHEISHALGTKDLYGVSGVRVNQSLSVMAGTPPSGHIFHLDPWHKLQLGWSEPTICDLSTGGSVVLPSAQLTNPFAPVILWDGARGSNEFFMLEYRTRTNSRGPGYDADVAGDGLVIWQVRQDANKDPVGFFGWEAGPIVGQRYWAWCSKCQGLVYTPGSPANCPAGGAHSLGGSGDYAVVMDHPTAAGEHHWRRCTNSNCGALYFGDNESQSVCLAGNYPHRAGTNDYSLVKDDPASPGQHDWRRCTQCQSLFYGPGLADSYCPAGGRHVADTNPNASGNYSMVYYAICAGAATLGAPNLRPGGNLVWGSGALTPYLTWRDGTPTQTRLHVRPFTVGADAITVEWWTETDTWVDFAYMGPGDGQFATPFNTFAEGTAAVSYGGTIHFKAGSSSETAHVTKRMNLVTTNGPVTIGR